MVSSVNNWCSPNGGYMQLPGSFSIRSVEINQNKGDVLKESIPEFKVKVL